MKCFTLIRADNYNKLKTAINDIEEHANLTILNSPKKIKPEKADEILVEILDSPLKKMCDVAAICKIDEEPAEAINTIKDIHPPAHIIVVSERHGEIYKDLENSFDELMKISR